MARLGPRERLRVANVVEEAERRLRHERRLPLLRPDAWTITSPTDVRYNCVAWAMGDTTANWWPEPDSPEYYWPEGALRDGTVEAFVDGFRVLGFEICAQPDLESEFDKIAVFATHAGSPLHVARQLPNGRWTSKLGNDEDIEHSRLEDLAGGIYGYPAVLLRKPRRQ